MMSTSLTRAPARGGVWLAMGPLAMGLLALGLVASDPAAADLECREGTGTPKLELSWPKLLDESSETLPMGSHVLLTVRNLTAQDLLVELDASAVLDHTRESVDLGSMIVPGSATLTTSVDLGGFGVAPSLLDFSGRLSIRAIGRLDQGAPIEAVAFAPHVFFHVDSANRLRVYRRGPLLDRYAAGDFGNRATKVRRWLVQRGLRPLGIFYQDPELAATDDDGGPPDAAPPQTSPSKAVEVMP